MFRFMLIFILVTSQVQAQRLPGRAKTTDGEFCNSVYEYFNQGGKDFDIDSPMADTFKNRPNDVDLKEIRKIVSDIPLFKLNKEAMLSSCEDDLANVRLKKASGVMGNVFGVRGKVFEVDPVQERLDVQKSACDEIKHDKECTPFDTDPANVGVLKDVANFVTPQFVGCNCIVENMRRDYKYTPEKLEEQKKITQNRMQGIILGSFGEKFINDYAVNMEDVSFFNTNSAKFFGKDESAQEKTAMDYQCSDVERYQSAITAKCSRNGISEEEQQNRLNYIFAGLKSRGDSKQPLKDWMFDLNRKIQVLNFEEETKPNAKIGYSRSSHDTKRFALSRKEPSSILLNEMVMKIMSDKTLSRQLNEMIGPQKMKPLDAVASIMTEETSRNTAVFREKFLIGKNVGTFFLANTMPLLLSKDAATRLNAFKIQIEMAMDMHPGIKSMMINKDIFLKTVDSAEKEKKTLAETLEMNDQILGEQYTKRCKALVEQLSEAACIPRNNLIGTVKGDDLTSLLAKQGYLSNKKFEELLICEAGNPEKTFDLFNDITMKNDFNRSDLLDRLTKPKDKQTNSFRLMADTKNDEVKKIVSQAVKETERERDEVKSSRLASNLFSEGKSEANPDKHFDVAPSVATVSRKPAATSEASEMSSNFQSTQANYAVPLVAPVMAPITESKVSNAKSEIRETVSNKDNQEKVEKFLSNTDDSSMKELLRLKEESLQNRQKLLELTSEREKQKLKDLEDKIKLLEQKKVMAETAPINAAEDEEMNSARTKGTYRGVARDIASVRPMETSGSYSGEHNGPTTGSSGGGGGSASLGGSGARGSSGAARNRSAESTGADGAGAAYIVVSSSGVSKDQSGASQEVSQELINYLSHSEPDLSSLRKLKDSGMLYKFKVMENGVLVEKEILVDYKTLNEDAKKLVEQKLAKRQNGQAGSLEQELVAAKRVYSFQSLKIILGEQLKKSNRGQVTTETSAKQLQPN